MDHSNHFFESEVLHNSSEAQEKSEAAGVFLEVGAPNAAAPVPVEVKVRDK
jgi:hypothetical protein